jgi:YVTN family beta-propeller protein
MSFLAIFSTINTAKADSVTKTISFDSNPFGLAFDSINGKVYVTSQNPGTLSVIDGSTNTIEDSVSLGVPQAIAFDSANNRLYITSPQGAASDPVFVIDPSTIKLLHAVFVGKDPFGIAVDAADNKIYVSNLHSDSVSVIDGSTDKVIKTIPVGHFPFGVAFNSVNGDVYVANQGSDTISVVDSSTDM